MRIQVESETGVTTNQGVLSSEILIARIVQLEYGNRDSDGNYIPMTIEDIRRIYIEETAEKPPNGISLYRSDEFKSKGKDSGFDGTVIHFYDQEKGINQSYTIPRGSESVESGGEGDGQPLDWVYNGLGIFTGKTNDQLEDFRKFEEWASLEINKFVEIEKNASKENIVIPELRRNGLGHSLGGNQIQMLYLLGVNFDSVYALNDAAPTVYQLAENDGGFFREVQIEFGEHIINPDELYELDPRKLQEFASVYYKSKGDQIHHITSEEDALYPLHLTRGFLRLGKESVIDTNPNLSELDNIIGRIPDRQLQSLQKYIAAASPYYEEEGMDGLFFYATGIDNKFQRNLNLLITGVSETEGLLSFETIGRRLITSPSKVAMNQSHAFNEIQKQIPVIQERMRELVLQIPALIIIVNAMSGEEGKRIIDHLRSLQERAEKVEKAMAKISTLNLKSVKGFMKGLIGIRDLFQELNGMISEMRLLWKTGKDLLSDIFGSFDAHKLDALINGMSQSNRRYVGNDLFYSAGEGASIIEVNISSASRLYWLGVDNYDQKLLVLERIQQAYIDRFVQPYEWRKKDLLSKISDMESNPHSYSYLLGGGDKEMISISVHETIPPMPAQITHTVEVIQNFYEADIVKGKNLFNQMKEAIIQLFSEDQQLTAIFELH